MTNCDCNNNGIKAYFKLDYKPNKLSQLANDTHYVDINDVLDEINTHNTSETAHTYIQGRIDATNTTIGDLTELDTSVKTSVVDAINSEVSARGNADTALENDYNAKIGTLSDLDSSVKTDVVSAINSVISDEATIVGDLDDLDTSVKTSIVTAINSEVSDRQSADSGLQTQIDALAASSDVTDIVGTYAELQAYDTQHLNDNDIIKVLDDSTHNDAPSYYRYNKSTDSFTYIGSESASYTKAESDTLFVPQTRTVNSKALSADITLTSSDVGALANTTTINDLTTTAQQNALNSGATSAKINQIATNTGNITTNANAISTINGKIPADASSSNKLVTASALSNAVVDLANQDLSNLTETGNDRLHALKGYEDAGELLTDAEGLADVKRYAHSTFDLSKFTVVGSPNITSDGIVSNISTGNDIRINTSNITFDYTDFSISSTYTIGNAFGTYVGFYAYNASSYSPVRYELLNTGKIRARFAKLVDGAGVLICELTTDTLQTNTTYKIDVGYADGSYYLKVNGNTVSSFESADLVEDIQRVFCYSTSIGSYSPDTPQDLKQLSITVDGVEVFSGNKTGIDTIKPDDYTVVGTPTISADGVLSNCSTTDYVKATTNITIGANDDFEIISPVFNISSRTSTYDTIFSMYASNNQNNALQCRISGNTLWLLWKDNNGADIIRNTSQTYSLNKNYQVKAVRKGTTYAFYYRIINETDWSLIQSTTSEASFNAEYILCYGLSLGNAYPITTGTLDLNASLFYLNGNLVYQPCLKIPYTESKTGSKIVSSSYRDRVNDMASQFGYANYYTLDEDNGNFTLPQVELYGLIGDKTLRDSYYNGVTYWELFSNRRLEQGGTCESGVEYTLPKPFADANYVLTIPYSSKTATSFIPSATGDFIAKGTGLL